MESTLNLNSEKDFQLFCQNCELFIREGQMQKTRQLIQRVNQNQIPREYRVKLARICRRIGALTEGLRLLKKVIFNQVPGEAPATPKEKCEYAVLLSRIGSTDEAISILSRINSSENPDIHLYHGFCLISQWNYQEASIQLQKYLALSQDPYLQLVAQVNLASTFISSRHYTQAHELLNSLIQKEERGENKRLLGNCLELRAQVYYYQNSIAQAENDLTAALDIFKQSHSYDELLVQKWRATIQAHKEHSNEALFQFREIAVQRSHWESVRECDLFILKNKFDQHSFDYLYFGTPYESFRTRLTEELQQSPSDSFCYGDPKGIILSLTTGEYESNGKDQISSKIQNLLMALVDDFYAPVALGSLFSKVYPGEHFDIESSPLRIRQVLTRLRKWFTTNNIHAAISQKETLYKIDLQKGLGFEIGSIKNNIADFNRNFERIRKQYANKNGFTIKEAVKDLALSRSDFHRIMKWATEKQLVMKHGRGKSTHYQITDASSAPLTLSKAS